jgi:hypothetical protein
METGSPAVVSQAACDHVKHRWYTQRRFDILNGFELVVTRCINCHKTVALEVKKLNYPLLLRHRKGKLLQRSLRVVSDHQSHTFNRFQRFHIDIKGEGNLSHRFKS